MVDPGSMGHRFAHAARWRRLCVGDSYVPRIFHGLRWGWVAEAETSTCCKSSRSANQLFAGGGLARQLTFDRKRQASLDPDGHGRPISSRSTKFRWAERELQRARRQEIEPVLHVGERPP